MRPAKPKAVRLRVSFEYERQIVKCMCRDHGGAHGIHGKVDEALWRAVLTTRVAFKDIKIERLRVERMQEAGPR